MQSYHSIALYQNKHILFVAQLIELTILYNFHLGDKDDPKLFCSYSIKEMAMCGGKQLLDLWAFPFRDLFGMRWLSKVPKSGCMCLSHIQEF